MTEEDPAWVPVMHTYMNTHFFKKSTFCYCSQACVFEAKTKGQWTFPTCTNLEWTVISQGWFYPNRASNWVVLLAVILVEPLGSWFQVLMKPAASSTALALGSTYSTFWDKNSDVYFSSWAWEGGFLLGSVTSEVPQCLGMWPCLEMVFKEALMRVAHMESSKVGVLIWNFKTVTHREVMWGHRARQSVKLRRGTREASLAHVLLSAFQLPESDAKSLLF